MNKKILLTALALVTFSACNTMFAADTSTYESQAKMPKGMQQDDFQRPPHGEFGKHHGDFHKYHPSKAEMEKKKAEFDKRLKLTEEQKKQIEENRQFGHKQVKPIFEQKRAKMHELRELSRNTSLTEEQKNSKASQLKADIKKLDSQANAYREQNMQKFEAILTDKQKKEFSKIKEEQKKDMEKRRAEFEKKMQKAQKEGKRPEGFPPPPPIED